MNELPPYILNADELAAKLVKAGTLPEDQLRLAVAEAKKKKKSLGEILLSRQQISDEQLAKFYAEERGLKYVDLTKEMIPRKVLEMIPEPIAKEHGVIAFAKDRRVLRLAMVDPEDLQTIEYIKKTIKLTTQPHLATRESVRLALRQYKQSLHTEFDEIIQKSIKESGLTGDKADLEKMAEDLPMIRIVDTVLHHAILQNASDIHIEPLEQEAVIRYRVDGILKDAMTLPKQILPGVIARIKVLANLKLDEHRLPQDGRFKIETDEYKIAFRVSVLPVFDGEKVVTRLLDESAKVFTLEQLGIRERDRKILERNFEKPNGLILVTGPTGSGKTTTLYTILNILNVPEVNISTVEDPIEYRMPRINQTQVKPKIGLTFASGLRSLLRQDPDIIMVGEIRDKETAEIAIHSALTGHLVLSTLHTNSAAGSLPRLLDMGAENFLVASTVNTIVGQRLVRKICPDCKTQVSLSSKEEKQLSERFPLAEIMSVLRKEGAVLPADKSFRDIEFYKGKGCARCGNSGYKGRVGIYETLEVTESIGDMLTKDVTSDQLENAAVKEGMATMVHDGFVKAATGITTLEEILRVTRE